MTFYGNYIDNYLFVKMIRAIPRFSSKTLLANSDQPKDFLAAYSVRRISESIFYVVTTDSDGAVLLREVSSGQLLRQLYGPANSAIFSGDGKQVYAGGADNLLRVWEVDINDLVDYACAVIGRDLTPAERQKYEIPFTEPVCE